MRFLPDERLYARTEECLRYLRALEPAAPPPGAAPRRHHLYWRGDFARKQAFAVKSLLATQDLARSELWLWLDAEAGWAGHEENPFLRPLLPFLRPLRFDPAREAADTPVAGRSELYCERNAVRRSNFVRFVVLYRHGGIYCDMDTLFLRDFGALPNAELCYRWSAGQPYANSAVLALRAGGATARELLLRCRELGSCRPLHVLRFAEGAELDLLVLPCAAFDPLWAHHDGKDSYEQAPFARFADFFQPVGPSTHPGSSSFRDLFPGAFTYHWHNFWDAAEPEDCWFGRFDRELDRLLAERLGIEPPRRPP